MSEPTNLEVVRGGKKEPCPYCGEQPHNVPLNCPRIRGVTIYQDEASIEIQFWPDGGADAA